LGGLVLSWGRCSTTSMTEAANSEAKNSKRWVRAAKVTLFALALGVVANFGVWWAVYHKLPTVPLFSIPRIGCLGRAVEVRTAHLIPARLQGHSIKNWIDNDICFATTIFGVILEMRRHPECGAAPLYRLEPVPSFSWESTEQRSPSSRSICQALMVED